MKPQHARPWCRWLCSSGVKLEHIAIVLVIDLAEVRAYTAYPDTWHGANRIPRLGLWSDNPHGRSIGACTAGKIQRLAKLGYPAERIAEILCLRPRSVRAFLKRVTPDRKAELTRPRTRREQRALDRNLRRRALARQAAASRAAWSRHDVRRDDDGAVSYDPPPAVELVVQVVAPEPVRWELAVDERGRCGSNNGHAKLTWELVGEIRRLHAEGVSRAELGRRFGVSESGVGKIVTHKTWTRRNEPVESPCPAPPPAVEPAPRKPRRRRGWRVAGEPKYGARGSGALHDDE